MAPALLRPRQGLKEKEFSPYFSSLKAQPYHDPAATRGTVSHKYGLHLHDTCHTS
jgi:hypothetical protein